LHHTTSRTLAAAALPSVIGGGAAVRTLETAVATLREQLAIANSRADQAEQRSAEKDVRIAYLRARADDLMRPLTHCRPWWRRWFL
jgi:hypothetical protein